MGEREGREENSRQQKREREQEKYKRENHKKKNNVDGEAWNLWQSLPRFAPTSLEKKLIENAPQAPKKSPKKINFAPQARKK